jgi:hypothetical protein
MPSSSRLTTFAESIGSIGSKVLHSLKPLKNHPSSTQNTDATCEDGRVFDWPALKQSSLQVQKTHTVLCTSKALFSAAASLETDEVLHSLFQQVKADRQAYRESLYTLNKRLTDASYLGLPTETDLRAQDTTAVVSLDPKDNQDDMSEAFSQMLVFISGQEEPCDRQTMERLTEGKPEYPNLHSALKSTLA